MLNNSIATRLRAHLGLKLLLLVALNAAVWTPYQLLQRIHFFPAITMPLSPVDQFIPFSTEAVWAYLSLYVLLPVGPFLFSDRGQIFRYSRGVVAMAAAATVIFIFCPTVCARPSGVVTNPAYRALVVFDNPYHAFPSLHAAFAIYSALCAVTVGRELKWRRISRGAFWIWAGLILYSTLATRQHVFADIAAGSFLGFAAYRIFLARPQTAPVLVASGLSYEN